MAQAADVYASQLSYLKHGLPLWTPEPSDSGEVMIGDVGYVYEGSFYRLFNTTVDKDHPFNANGVPDGFQQLENSPSLLHRTANYLEVGPLHSQSVTHSVVNSTAQNLASLSTLDGGVQYRFSCAQNQGAVLVIASPSMREIVDPNPNWRNYISEHYDSWCAFLKEKHLDSNLPLILVRGWVKTAAWAVAVFDDAECNYKLVCDIQEGSCASPSFSTPLETNYAEYKSSSGRATSGKKPRCRSLPDETGEDIDIEGIDQCVFLSYYKLCKAPISRPAFESQETDGNPSQATLEAVVSTHFYDVEEDDSGSSSSYESDTDILLEYILRNSKATAAIASDSDIHRLIGFQEDPWPNSLADYLDEIQPRIAVNDNGGGYLVFDEDVVEA